MLAKETASAFDDKDWLFEIKWDGYRAISEIKDGNVLLYSRNGNSFINDYPLVVKELKKIKHDAVLDGEIVILNEAGKSDFQKLQHYEDNIQYPICYYVFDLLSLNGNETSELPLIERKELLKKLLPKNAVIKYSEHIIAKGKGFFEAANKNDLEGIMAKKTESLYHPGARTGDWFKIKYDKSQEVIIAGFTQPTESRKYFEQVKDFAHFLCMMVNEQLPKFTSLERNLQKRGNNKIYLDYLQTCRGQTIASVYSLRPHAGGTISMPLLWKEVKPGLTPSAFIIDTALPIIKKMGDIFLSVMDKGIDIKKCVEKLS